MAIGKFIAGILVFVFMLNLPCTAVSTKNQFTAVDQLINASIKNRAFPSATLAIVTPDSVILHNTYGKLTYSDSANVTSFNTIYDLASLTKAFATTLSLMKLYDEGAFKLSDPYSKYFPDFGQNGKESITIRQMLLHQSGLIPFRAYRKLCSTKNDLITAIYQDSCIVKPGIKTIYSDLNFILLGELVEKCSGKPLAAFFADTFAKPMNLRSTFFNPTKGAHSLIAPTEADTDWPFERNRPLVHDPNAALMGGVAGHAGLFSTSTDLIKLVQMLLNEGNTHFQAFIKPETLRLFTTRDKHLKSRALGWDLKSYGGKSSAGKYLSLKSYGHLGFTGTSVWIDPEREMGIIFLTNRVYPTSANKQIRRVRRELHSLIIECLETNPGPTP